MLRNFAHQFKKLIKREQFVYTKTSSKIWLYAKSYHHPVMLSFFNQIDSYLSDNNEETYFFKATPGDKTTVGLVKVNNQLFVIKRYNIKGFWHFLKVQFRKSHAFRSFVYADFLKDKGINTIKPIGVIQEKIFVIKLKSYFVSLYEEGVKGCEYFHDDSTEKQHWPFTIDAIIEITTKMKKLGIYHGDYHFGNFVIVNKQPFLLDFDRITIINNVKRFNYFHAKDIANFSRYLRRNSVADQLFSSRSIIFK